VNAVAAPAPPFSRRTTAVVLSAAAVLVFAALGLQSLREQRYAMAGSGRDVLYVRSAEAVGRAVLSFDALAADVYWIRAIQHYGGRRLSSDADQTYPLLYPLLDLATSLDTRFTVAYRFGAIFLAESPPGGPGRPDLSLALLDKGLRAQPERWQYAMDAGFVYYWWVQDYKAAAAWFDRASRIPGAPWWLRALAATTLAEGGDRRSSRQMWQQVLDTADNDWLRKTAGQRLAQLDALDGIDAVAAAVGRFVAATSRFPDSWTALVRAGVLRGVPVDPAGTAFVLDRTVPGGVTLSRTSPLFPLPPQFTRKASPQQ
jgi:tetratricopeptide (TPR) repeat protein